MIASGTVLHRYQLTPACRRPAKTPLGQDFTDTLPHTDGSRFTVVRAWPFFRSAGSMPGTAPVSGDDDGRDWPEHPVREVEEIFQEAAVAGCIIFRFVHTVTSPNVFPWIVFPVRVPDASSIRKHMIADLRRQLERMLASEIEGQG